MALLRYLMMVNCSLIISCLNCINLKLDLNILVYIINQFCSKYFTIHKIFPLVLCRSDLSYQTGLEKLYFMTYGSLKLWFIFQKINNYCFSFDLAGKQHKLFITENIPVNIFFIKLTYWLVYIQTKIFYVRLTNIERVNLIRQFNDYKDLLLVLIIMYQVSTQGVNLNACCNRVLIKTPVRNSLSDMQT